ncbi:hypothetical protein RF11_12214 [Thelohanellus kitauei]|uniref:Integrase catalytic domain-containing protein n=1 Tax=Thelohanellus kitauei TaxID=669202 RepID=A0A0C2JW49_THEKT|nr:hypothetical protein RF11_12214 [Thelohanellus kitauei]
MAMPKQDARTQARIFRSNITSRYGVPSSIRTDIGCHFESTLINNICHKCATAYLYVYGAQGSMRRILRYGMDVDENQNTRFNMVQSILGRLRMGKKDFLNREFLKRQLKRR